ncbi:MAG: hypothetical protein ACOYBE_11495 [Blautia sp.]|jgi:hypothetical protein
MNKTKLVIRILAGLYLLYSAYSLGKAYLSGQTASIPIIVAAVVFLVFGASFIVTGLRDMKRLSVMEAEAAQQEAKEAQEEEPEAIEEAEPEETPKKMSISEKARLTANLVEDGAEEETVEPAETEPEKTEE